MGRLADGATRQRVNCLSGYSHRSRSYRHATPNCYGTSPIYTHVRYMCIRNTWLQVQIGRHAIVPCRLLINIGDALSGSVPHVKTIGKSFSNVRPSVSKVSLVSELVLCSPVSLFYLSFSFLVVSFVQFFYCVAVSLYLFCHERLGIETLLLAFL